LGIEIIPAGVLIVKGAKHITKRLQPIGWIGAFLNQVESLSCECLSYFGGRSRQRLKRGR